MDADFFVFLAYIFSNSQAIYLSLTALPPLILLVTVLPFLR